jgi:hypothetical protein
MAQVELRMLWDIGYRAIDDWRRICRHSPWFLHRSVAYGQCLLRRLRLRLVICGMIVAGYQERGRGGGTRHSRSADKGVFGVGLRQLGGMGFPFR